MNKVYLVKMIIHFTIKGKAEKKINEVESLCGYTFYNLSCLDSDRKDMGHKASFLFLKLSFNLPICQP